MLIPNITAEDLKHKYFTTKPCYNKEGLRFKTTMDEVEFSYIDSINLDYLFSSKTLMHRTGPVIIEGERFTTEDIIFYLKNSNKLPKVIETRTRARVTLEELEYVYRLEEIGSDTFLVNRTSNEVLTGRLYSPVKNKSAMTRVSIIRMMSVTTTKDLETRVDNLEAELKAIKLRMGW